MFNIHLNNISVKSEGERKVEFDWLKGPNIN